MTMHMTTRNGYNKRQSGQAIVVLLVFSVIGITITTAAVAGMLAHATTASKVEMGNRAHAVAESGAENAIIRLIRDPTYTGETLTVGEGNAIVTVTGDTSTKTIVSHGVHNDFSRSIRLTVTITDTAVTVTSWKEEF